MFERSRPGLNVHVWRGSVGVVALHASRPWIARSFRARTEVIDTAEGRVFAAWDDASGADRSVVWCGDRLVTTSLVDVDVVVRSRLLPDVSVVAEARWEELDGVFRPAWSARGGVLFVPGKDPSWPTCGHGTWLDGETLAVRDQRRFVRAPDADWVVRDRQSVGLHPHGDRVTVVEESLETNDWRLANYGTGPTFVGDILQPTHYESSTCMRWLRTDAVLLSVERDEGSSLVEDLFCFVASAGLWRAHALRDADGGAAFRWAADVDGAHVATAVVREGSGVYGLRVHATSDGRVLASRAWEPAWGELDALHWDPQGRVVAVARTSAPEAFSLVRWEWVCDRVTVDALPGLEPDDNPYPIGRLGPALVLSTDRTGLLLCE